MATKPAVFSWKNLLTLFLPVLVQAVVNGLSKKKEK